MEEKEVDEITDGRAKASTAWARQMHVREEQSYYTDVQEGSVFLSHSLAVSKCTMPYDSSTPTAIIHAAAVVHVPLMDIISSN